MNKRGFSLYLTFIVTTVVFLLVTGSYEISRIALDLARSDAAETIVFHAADGGLERGLAKLNQQFKPFRLDYTSMLDKHRRIAVNVEAVIAEGMINLHSTAVLYEGGNEIARRGLARLQISDLKGRTNIGKFVEAT
jgi:Tfp pilus assembly protein PilX